LLRTTLSIDLGINKKADAVAGTNFHVEIELPLVAEYFLSDHFSICGQVGLVVNVIGPDGATVTPVTGKGASDAKGFGIGLGNGLEATGGFSFYF
jgi:hypothetical protein